MIFVYQLTRSMKKSVLLLVALLFAFVSLQAQETPVEGPQQKTWMLRFHNTVGWRWNSITSNSSIREVDFLAPSAGIYWKGNKRFGTEIQLIGLSGGNSDGYDQVVDTSNQTGELVHNYSSRGYTTRVRAELLRELGSVADSKLRFSAGVGLDYGMGFWKYVSYLSSDFPQSSSSIRLGLAASARMSYQFHPRWAFDFLLPFTFASFEWSNYRVQNPAQPPAEQSTSSITYLLFPPDYGLRFGFSVTL